MGTGIPLPLGKCDFPDYEVLYLPQYFSSSCYFRKFHFFSCNSLFVPHSDQGENESTEGCCAQPLDQRG